MDEQTVLARLAQLQRRRTLGTLPRIQGALLELIGFATENHADELQSLSESRVHLQGRSDALRRVLKYLLAHSRDRVYAVANAVGFADEAYFTRRFRQRFGVSPSQYRRAMQSGLEPATG